MRQGGQVEMFPLLLSDLPLPPTYYNTLQRAGYELETDLLLAPFSEVHYRLRRAGFGGRGHILSANTNARADSNTRPSTKQICNIVNEAAHHLAPKAQTCSALLRSEAEWSNVFDQSDDPPARALRDNAHSRPYNTEPHSRVGAGSLTIGDQQIDSLLGGGFRCGMLTEIVGER